MDEIILKENHIPKLMVDESVPSVSTSKNNTIQSRISEYKQNNTVSEIPICFVTKL